MKKVFLLFTLFFACIAMSFGQKMVTGTIVDNDGLSVIGANVLVKGTTVGTITDIDGSFSLNVPEGSNMIVVSYTGFGTQEIDVSQTSGPLDITLAAGELLDEVVVTAGGLEKNKARLGYAIQNVDSDELVNAQEVNLVNALNSKVAGVQVVSSSGSPGASANIRIRGNTSVNGSNSPLFVVDGVPIDNSSTGNGTDGVDQSNRAIDINPNDIASMTVLKGPSATALYGVRAANGAIIITTKKGSSGKPKVSISSSYSMDQVNKLPERQSTYAQGRVTDGVASYLGPATANGFSWGPRISDLEFDGSDNPFDRNGTLVPVGEGNGTPARVYDPYTFFVNGTSLDFNASVSGGSEDLQYYISAGRLKSNGIVPNSEFARNSFRVNVSAGITDKLKGGMSANYVTSGGDRIQRGSNLNGVMLGLLRTSPTFDNGNGKEGKEAADDESTYVQENGDQRSYRNGIYDNPYWTANRNPYTDAVNRIIGNTYLTYNLNQDINITAKVGVDQWIDEREGGFDIQTNPFRPVSGSVFQQTINNRDLNFDLTANYNTNLTDNLTLNVLGGYNVFQTNRSNEGTFGTSLAVPGFFDISNATDILGSNLISRKRLYGVYGTADFGFNDYLFVNLTGRNDWSSILPVDNNTFQSYSASMGLVITELLNVNANVIDYGKIRASYGKVGNDGGNAFIYATQNVFEQASVGGDGFITPVSYPNFGLNAFERSNLLGNATLRPEATKTFEVGAELSFLKGRFGADITYYSSRSEDVIIATQISAATGFTNLVQNSAVITNSGIELIIDGTPIKRSNFSWDFAINFTQSENDVEELAEGVESVFLDGFVSTSAEVVAGQPFSALFGTGWQRTDDGRVVVGQDGWPLADPNRKALGDPNPDWTAGFRNTLTMGSFTASALLDIRSGGDMWCGTCGIMDYFGTSAQSADEREDVVVFDGVVNTGTADEPVYVENNTAVALGSADESASYTSFYRVRNGFGGISEMSIFDTSWLRLRELTLSYQLPANILGTSFAGGSISLTGRNLWLSTDYPGIDPETNLTGDSNGYGLDYFNMPNTKSYTATVRLNF